ncbi:hypothetical protein Esti_001407 [Eimeria stiedai]
MSGALHLTRAVLAITYRQRVPYGTEAYKKAKQQTRAAACNARKMKEAKGILVEGRKSLYMSLQQNTGISWYRSLQVLKHLEMHWRANPPMNNKLKEKIAAVADVVKQGR